MCGGYVYKYGVVGLPCHWSRNCHAWVLGTRYRVCRVDLENRTLVYFGGGLESYCLGSGDGCRYVGVDVSLGRVMAAQRSLRRLFTLILAVLVLPDCLVS